MMRRHLACLAFTLALVSSLARATVRTSGADAGLQIHWQRSLDDALAIATAEHRPLLVAVNLDGESACDRIVTERYREAQFVALASRCACVIGHPFRHNPKDHDENGRRIPCPRLGAITCGEHIALEPVLYDKYLGGERVAPRHAVIRVDGSKAFDLFYLFDFRDLDAALTSELANAPAASPEPDLSAASFDDLASGRDARVRSELERRIAEESDEGKVLLALKSVEKHGDSGSIEALRAALGRPNASSAILGAAEDAALRLKLRPELAAIVRERIGALGSDPSAHLLGRDAQFLVFLARLAPSEPTTRALILLHLCVGDAADRATAHRAAIEVVGGRADVVLGSTLTAVGGDIDLDDLLHFGLDVGATRTAKPKPSDAPGPEPELLVELDAADRALAAAPNDGPAMFRFAVASLTLARSRVDSKGAGVPLLLQDAKRWLEAAAKKLHDKSVDIERARAAYYLGDFAEEERIADEIAGGALRDPVAPGGPITPTAKDQKKPRITLEENLSIPGDASPDLLRAASLLDANVRVEALRWLGDACARELEQGWVAKKDLSDQVRLFVRAARSFALVCAARDANDGDYLGLSSFLGLIGGPRFEVAVLRTGCQRFPEVQSLRDALRDALWRAGRVEMLTTIADELASANPKSGACAWYAGYARVLAAEDLRRRARIDDAIARYGEAITHFDASRDLEPAIADSALQFHALCTLGSANAHIALGRRKSAADALAAGIALHPAVAGARDGLDRDALDVVDGVLEWREGAPSDVDPTAFADQMEKAEPKTAKWDVAIADSELREALRADGRSDVKKRAPVEVDDAQGKRTEEREVPVPSAEGDAFLERSIAIARRAFAITADDETRHMLAQALTIRAERRMQRGTSVSDCAADFNAAAQLLSVRASGNDETALRSLAAALRAQLGEARPRFRPGR